MNTKITCLPSTAAIPAETWDRCAFGDKGRQSPLYNPFISHAFFSSLEDSGSATADTGWQPQHIIIEKGENIIGLLPLFLKNHSYGEYVFDHSWADAYERAGGHYYPKMQASVPFSPVTTARLLVVPDQDDIEALKRSLIDGAIQRARDLGVSSLHFTFPLKQEWDLMADAGLLQRMDQQFHWVNEGYKNFEDFLAALSSRKRKNIRKERQQALANDIEIHILTGDDIREEHWDSYYMFYQDTGQRKWGRPYLNRQFFSLLGQRLKDDIVLIMCQRQGRYIAGALNLKSYDSLYGRYWGCIEDHRFLHFEVCYYQAIEYAITHGLKKVEAGAQGPHKLARGYLPTPTYSAHWLANESFHDAVARYLMNEREDVLYGIEQINEQYSPYKRDL